MIVGTLAVSSGGKRAGGQEAGGQTGPTGGGRAAPAASARRLGYMPCSASDACGSRPVAIGMRSALSPSFAQRSTRALRCSTPPIRIAWTRLSLVITSGSLPGRWARSEEHTSELQSRLHLVCRLLLEKKKKSI